MANVDLPLHEVLGAFVNATAAELLEAAPSEFRADATFEEGQSRGFKDMHGPAYTALCKFIRKEEDPGRKARCFARCRSCLRSLSRKDPPPCENDWRTNMVQVENGIGGWAWVRQTNEDEYKRLNVTGR